MLQAKLCIHYGVGRFSLALKKSFAWKPCAMVNPIGHMLRNRQDLLALEKDYHSTDKITGAALQCRAFLPNSYFFGSNAPISGS